MFWFCCSLHNQRTALTSRSVIEEALGLIERNAEDARQKLQNASTRQRKCLDIEADDKREPVEHFARKTRSLDLMKTNLAKRAL